jgi:hypothetical protein
MPEFSHQRSASLLCRNVASAGRAFVIARIDPSVKSFVGWWAQSFAGAGGFGACEAGLEKLGSRNGLSKPQYPGAQHGAEAETNPKIAQRADYNSEESRSITTRCLICSRRLSWIQRWLRLELCRRRECRRELDNAEC